MEKEAKYEKGVLIDDDDKHIIEGKAVSFSTIKYKGKKWVYATIWHNGKNHLLHRVIMNAKKGEIVDHINRNTLDNRKINLRICTQSNNCANSVSCIKSSKYKGVSVCKHTKKKKYKAQITKDKKTRTIGRFYTEKEAAKAYDIVAKELHGKFALTNKELGLL